MLVQRRAKLHSSIPLLLNRMSSKVVDGKFHLRKKRGEKDVLLQVFGANTGVGKSVVSTGLCASSLRYEMITSYIKPVQTGSDSDASSVVKNLKSLRILNLDKCRISSLFNFTEPISPHLAALNDGIEVSDSEVLGKLLNEIDESLTYRHQQCGSLTLIETAGGVLSPGPSGSLQADLYRPLRLNVLLVGDPDLGGIGTTLSAVESLRLRGYTIVGVAFIGSNHVPESTDEYSYSVDNAHMVESKLSALKIPVFRLGKRIPPSDVPLDSWHRSASCDFDSMLNSLQSQWQNSIENLTSQKNRGLKRLWWPFTQHSTLPSGSILTIDSAYGNYFEVLNDTDNSPGSITTRALLDSPASWWTQGTGHGDPDLTMAIASASGRFGHVMFPGVSHEPAIKLAEEMVEKGPGRDWASRAFFSDDGSTGMEIAIKMAFKKFMKDHMGSSDLPKDVELQVVAQSGCYHGDTLGTMNIAEPSIFNMGQHPWYTPKGLFFSPPTLAWQEGTYRLSVPPDMAQELSNMGIPLKALQETFFNRAEAFDLLKRSVALKNAYERQAENAMNMYEKREGDKKLVLGAVVIEPLMLGAGGMYLVDPLWQQALILASRRRGLPVVFDEVFSGLWRLGYESCREALNVNPDIACYAKLLSGGLLPISLTLTSESVFEAFSGESKAEALLHGHSYTGYPVGCAAALYALEAYKAGPNFRGQGVPMHEQWGDSEGVRELSLIPGIERSVSIGNVLAFEVKSEERGYNASVGMRIAGALKEAGVYSRPLGNVIYCMVTPLTTAEECKEILGLYNNVLNQIKL